MVPIEHFPWSHVFEHGRRIAQTDWDIQGSHVHHERTRSSCTWTTNGEVHGETITHNNVKKMRNWILIYVAIEAAMLEDNMASCKNAVYTDGPTDQIYI